MMSAEELQAISQDLSILTMVPPWVYETPEYLKELQRLTKLDEKQAACWRAPNWSEEQMKTYAAIHAMERRASAWEKQADILRKLAREINDADAIR